MQKRVLDSILRSYYASKERYGKVADEIRRLFDAAIDPSVPSDSIYTITHRLKHEDRLLEKVKQKAVRTAVNESNYQRRIEDLLGLRIVCLRLSDVEKVERFLDSLRKEGKLIFVKGPTRKQTFVLPVNPGEGLPKGIDLQYSGYSSIHCVARLGRTLRPPKEMASLQAEIQVRTILEEAWGEIDHKYRYERSRGGKQLPPHIIKGFYNFSAYLQAATLQAEYLCEEVESLTVPVRKPRKRRASAPNPSAPPISIPRIAVGPSATQTSIADVIEKTMGFRPSERLRYYILKRLGEAHVTDRVPEVFESEILTGERLREFEDLYWEETGGQLPFSNIARRDVDAINAVNFALFARIQPLAVAVAGARSVLKTRFATVGPQLVGAAATRRRRRRIPLGDHQLT